MRKNNWYIGKYSEIIEKNGNLSVLEKNKEFNFNVKRIFFINNVPNKVERGFHCHKELNQVLICVKGSVDIILDCVEEKEKFNLNEKQNEYIYLNGKVWREMKNFSTDCVLLVLCDKEYKYDEVIYDYDKFKELNNEKL